VAASIQQIRETLNKAQPAQERDVTIVTATLRIDRLRLYKRPDDQKPDAPGRSRRVAELNVAILLFSSADLRGSGVGAVVYWVTDPDTIGAKDALQYLELFRDVYPRTQSGAVECGQLRRQPFDGVTEVVQAALIGFRSAYPSLFVATPNAKLGSLFSYPLLYIGSIDGTRNASDIHREYGRLLTALSRIYRVWDAAIKPEEIRECFQGDLLQYDYGVILPSASATVEAHCAHNVPKESRDKQLDALELVLMVERPVMQHFNLMRIDLEQRAELSDFDRSRLLNKLQLRFLVVPIASVVALAAVKSGYRLGSTWVAGFMTYDPLLLLGLRSTLSVESRLMIWLSLAFVASLSIYIGLFVRTLWKSWDRRRSIAALASRYKTAPIMGEATLGRVHGAYIRVFSTEQLSRSVETGQATLDAILDSSFRLFIAIVTPLIALFIALTR
jgi:hypothetical protein